LSELGTASSTSLPALSSAALWLGWRRVGASGTAGGGLVAGGSWRGWRSRLPRAGDAEEHDGGGRRDWT